MSLVNTNGQLERVKIINILYMMDELFVHLGKATRFEALVREKYGLGNYIILCHPDKSDIKYEVNKDRTYNQYEKFSELEWDYLKDFKNISEVLYDIYDRYSNWETIKTKDNIFILSEYTHTIKYSLCTKNSLCFNFFISYGLPKDLIESRILNDYIKDEADIISSRILTLLLAEVFDIYLELK